VWAHFLMCGRIKGCGQPYDPHLLTWTFPILAPKAVEGRFLASVLAGMAVGRCAAGPLGGADPPLSRGMNCLRLVTLRILLE
jgi:hypothetical protein